jgi:hypothetical protein
MSQPGKSDNQLHSERFEAFVQALETLYIKGNQGARITFNREWPAAARFAFGQELIDCDTSGTPDRERRKILEDDAENRRLELIDIAATLESKSVDKGILQVEYVEALVKNLGRDLSLVLYSPRVVDRFMPPPVALEIPLEPVAAPPRQEPPISRTIEPATINTLDQVQPISLAPPKIETPVVKTFAPAQDAQVIKPISIPKFEDLKKKPEGQGQL